MNEMVTVFYLRRVVADLLSLPLEVVAVTDLPPQYVSGDPLRQWRYFGCEVVAPDGTRRAVLFRHLHKMPMWQKALSIVSIPLEQWRGAGQLADLPITIPQPQQEAEA